jgi:hypothetical protein
MMPTVRRGDLGVDEPRLLDVVHPHVAALLAFLSFHDLFGWHDAGE